MKTTRIAASGILTLLVSSPLFAYVGCQGTISELALSPVSGIVTVANGWGAWYVCNINSNTNGVSVDMCKTMYAQLTFALATNRRVEFDFDNGSSGSNINTSYCTSLGTWVTPNPLPYLLQLMDY